MLLRGPGGRPGPHPHLTRAELLPARMFENPCCSPHQLILQMGALKPWEEDCHAAIKCMQLGLHFTAPAPAQCSCPHITAWGRHFPQGRSWYG